MSSSRAQIFVEVWAPLSAATTNCVRVRPRPAAPNKHHALLTQSYLELCLSLVVGSPTALALRKCHRARGAGSSIASARN